MRVVFERDDEEDFIELILSDEEIEELKSYHGIARDVYEALGPERNLSVFIRRGSTYAAKKYTF